MTVTADAPAEQHDGPAPGRRGLPVLLVPVGLAVALVALTGRLLLGRSAAAGPGRVTDAVSVGFARDMGAHHAQAVAMSEIAHRRSVDPALNYLAFDVLSTQQGQIGIMSGWLDLSDQSQSGNGERMAWMGHAGPMPGMATAEQIEQLNTLPVPQMEEQWLRLMIRHHRGAIPMADAAAEDAGSPDIALLAQKMSAGQQSEIDAMQDVLRQRGLAPEDTTTGHGMPAGVLSPGGHAGDSG